MWHLLNGINPEPGPDADHHVVVGPEGRDRADDPGTVCGATRQLLLHLLPQAAPPPPVVVKAVVVAVSPPAVLVVRLFLHSMVFLSGPPQGWAADIRG